MMGSQEKRSLFEKKKWQSLLVFCMTCLFLTSASAFGSIENSDDSDDLSRDIFKESFCARIDLALNDLSSTSTEINETTSEFLQDLFWRLRFCKEVEILAFDHEIRPHVHPLHNILERVISQVLGKDIHDLSIFIHTNNPQGDPCGDLHRHFSPLENPTLNYYLSKGVEVYIVRPSPSIFRETAQVKATRIEGFDSPSYFNIDIVSDKIPSHIEGVTYTFSTSTGERYLCGIRAKTEGSPYAVVSFDLFLGKEEELISRIAEVQGLIAETQTAPKVGDDSKESS